MTNRKTGYSAGFAVGGTSPAAIQAQCLLIVLCSTACQQGNPNESVIINCITT